MFLQIHLIHVIIVAYDVKMKIRLKNSNLRMDVVNDTKHDDIFKGHSLTR